VQLQRTWTSQAWQVEGVFVGQQQVLRSSTLRLVSMATRSHTCTRVLEHIRTTSAILGRSITWAFPGGFTLLAVVLAAVNVAALLGRRSLCRRGKPTTLHQYRPGARSESYPTEMLHLIVHCSEKGLLCSYFYFLQISEPFAKTIGRTFSDNLLFTDASPCMLVVIGFIPKE
jgi:hypothetical protein